ncbi:MAG: DUF503 domain-containing protein [Gammaproteobacteria bacterium]|nr:DUF503 domain-containing protein [Gammaproteobacteria bacterium]
MMHVGILGLDFHLAGCRSLKEKRSRLKRLRDKLGRSTSLAVCESGYQDVLHRAQWSVVAVASSQRVVERSLGDVERWVQEGIDATLVNIEREIFAA